MTDLVIVGTGGQAREIHELLEARDATSPWTLLGFLDDSGETRTVHELPVLGTTDWLEQHAEVAVVVGVGSSRVRRAVAERLRGLGVSEFPTLVHPAAHVGTHVQLGVGSIVGANAVVTTDVYVGEFGLINFGATVGHDVVAGDFVTVAPGANVSGSCSLEDGCDVGTGASIVQGMKIGEWAIVGAGATVIEDVPANSTVVGTPARVTEQRLEGWHLSD